MSLYRPRSKDGAFKSPYWHFDTIVRLNGQRCRLHGSTGETTKARAREEEKKAVERAKAGKPNDHLTLAAASVRYCDEVARHQPSVVDTEKALEHCCRLIGGGRLLVNLTADDLADAMRRRAGETVGKKNPRLVKPATVNRQILEPMKRLMRRARRVWKVSVDVEDIDWAALALKEPKERVREFTADEAEAFWKALRPDYVPLVWFLGRRGFRVNSVLAMGKRHVDLANRRVQIWRKGDGLTWFPLAADHVAVLSAEMKKAPQARLWTFEAQRRPHKGMRKPITYSGLRRVINNTLEAAEIEDFRIHDLRHDFASKLLRATRNLAVVQKALGHADIASTMRYAHVLDEDVVAGLEEMSRNSPGMAATAEAKTEAK